MQFIINRLKEPSTWRGIVLFAVGVLGVRWSPESQQAVVSAGVGVAGLLGMVLPDAWKK